jgi:hypothetical protein
MNILKTQKNKEKGFVILFAILISSIILLITSGMFNVIQKQVLLSAYSRESQRAFYASDAAIECALFHDISPFLEKTHFPMEGISPDLKCGGSVIQVQQLGQVSEEYDKTFAFRYFSDDDQVGCSYILVEKSLVGGLYETRITAAGFNTCIEQTVDEYTFRKPDFDDPSLLERRLTVSYQGA